MREKYAKKKKWWLINYKIVNPDALVVLIYIVLIEQLFIIENIIKLKRIDIFEGYL